jgi:hypothetical protein
MIICPVSASACPNACLSDQLRQDVFDIHAIGEFDQTDFDVASCCQITSGRQYACQPCKIGGNQRRIVAAFQFCLNDDFEACLVDVGYKPKLIIRWLPGVPVL